MANGDKVSNLVHNVSLEHFKANGDILRSYARCLSKHIMVVLNLPYNYSDGGMVSMFHNISYC